MRVLFLLVMFLFLSAFFIISNENLALKEKEDRVTFARYYYSWLVGFGENFKSITGDVIKAEWIPAKTNFSIQINVTK